MSVQMWAFLERKCNGRWELVDIPACPERDAAATDSDIAPTNIAPPSWGKFNFNHYYALSGDRDLPDDLSTPLRAYVDRHWPEPNRPSWMSLAEIAQHATADRDGRYAHLDWETLLKQGHADVNDLRVIFWAD
jgi:hypothetical protein